MGSTRGHLSRSMRCAAGGHSRTYRSCRAQPVGHSRTYRSMQGAPLSTLRTTAPCTHVRSPLRINRRCRTQPVAHRRIPLCTQPVVQLAERSTPRGCNLATGIPPAGPRRWLTLLDNAPCRASGMLLHRVLGINSPCRAHGGHRDVLNTRSGWLLGTTARTSRCHSLHTAPQRTVHSRSDPSNMDRSPSQDPSGVAPPFTGINSPPPPLQCCSTFSGINFLRCGVPVVLLDRFRDQLSTRYASGAVRPLLGTISISAFFQLRFPSVSMP